MGRLWPGHALTWAVAWIRQPISDDRPDGHAQTLRLNPHRSLDRASGAE